VPSRSPQTPPFGRARLPRWPARSRAWCVGNTRVSHHGDTGNTRHSPRNGFNGLLRDLPGDRACLSPSSADTANLTPASRRQNHTTSPSAGKQRRQPAAASTASRAATVTITCRPSVGGTDESIKLFLANGEAEYFRAKGWTGNSVICPSGQSVEPERTCDYRRLDRQICLEAVTSVQLS
jgi:hypothetical protein